MLTINRQDASDVERSVDRFFASTGTGRAQALRSLFVETLDFVNSTGFVSLGTPPKNSPLPLLAERIASMEGLHVVYVPLNANGPDRVRKADAGAAAKIINDTLHGDLLLVMTNPTSSQLHFISPTFVGATPSLRRITIARYLPKRTAVEQLSKIYHEWKNTGSIRLAVEKAFDVEAVTKWFFEEYKRVFEDVIAAVEGFGRSEDKPDAKKFFVQALFNRLMFTHFLSHKGWLKFNGEIDYLNALWRDHVTRSKGENFYETRLKPLFFEGMNKQRSEDLRTSNPELYSLIGNPPFLNGGLFDRTEDDKHPDTVVPDGAIDLILHQLFDRFNFTVMESTPFDVEVAVDPEMLGKVFEELVTGRHDTGSYYTPRPVVSFMCREALKGYLESQNTGASKEAVREFVDKKDTRKLTVVSAPKVGDALEKVTIVDPAQGSGAYLLGMMLELVDLMTALYSDQLSHDTKDLYSLKLQIIENNLYGADIDPFAVNIAMLRLWLSLAIEYEGPLPQPLPNLNFKIVCGDSLLGPDPSPENYGNLFRRRIHRLAGQLTRLKQKHMRQTGQSKVKLAEQIKDIQADLREALVDSSTIKGAIDWRVEFAEVFDHSGGFDVVITNPPYGARLDNLAKTLLKGLYPISAVGKFDTYRLFIELSGRLACPGGALALIIPNTWLAMDSAVGLRRLVLDCLTVDTIVRLPQDVFKQMVDPIILCGRNTPNNGQPISVKVLALQGGAQMLSSANWTNTRAVSPAEWRSDPLVRLSLVSDEKGVELKAKLLLARNPLSDFVNIRQGIIPYLTKSDARANLYIRESTGGAGWFPYLDGSRHVDQFVIKGAISYISYGSWLYASRDRSLFSGPRIVCQLIRNISLKRRLVGAYLLIFRYPLTRVGSAGRVGP